MSDGFSLVMPFVTVASKGGPHDDVSYVAGYEMGLLAAKLAEVAELRRYEYRAPLPIRRENLPQADLIGMRHNYTIVVDGHADLMPYDAGDEWVYVTFVMADAGEPQS